MTLMILLVKLASKTGLKHLNKIFSTEFTDELFL